MNRQVMRRAAALGLLAGLAVSCAAAQETCSATVAQLHEACLDQTEADHGVARAICLNLRSAAARRDCREDASKANDRAKGLCVAQRDWRKASCAVVGEQRYDPKVDPKRFDTDYHHLSHPNPYFPLEIGKRWEYSGGDELNTIEVVDETKLIEGVTAIVLRDLVYVKERLHEATDDWFAAAKDGTSWYLGEEVKNYESFKGDVPRRSELVNVSGSVKHGRNGDKGGVIMPAAPAVGQVYREEFSLANAEDVAEVLSITYAYGAGGALDEFVPAALAHRLCADGDCVVTKNYSLLEPGVVARKYYARDIGLFLETVVGVGIGVQLTGCNFDPRCDSLPPR
ncbi:MAG TPA: hypothetical protein VFY73_25625 [Ideonella sp.]|uniref:hypothetical protein n=1 Tax=Ideonella sp. TaxID=1929293 RepID=UPI002E35AFD6|nr:hypothetical protein [Ideonella sp.]HEX5687411.1 hypothetical protein [Ideonella sp.]